MQLTFYDYHCLIRAGLDAAAGRLRAREESWKEYDIVEKDSAPATGDFMPSWLYGEDYAEGLRVKKEYLKRYDGISLEEAIKGKPVRNEMGECYLVESSAGFSLSKIDKEKARTALLSNLRLLRGIGQGTERKLRIWRISDNRRPDPASSLERPGRTPYGDHRLGRCMPYPGRIMALAPQVASAEPAFKRFHRYRQAGRTRYRDTGPFFEAHHPVRRGLCARR